MREAVNNNPLVQVALVAVLLISTGFFVMSSMGGGGEEESESSSASSSTTTTTTTTTATVKASTPGAAVATALALASGAPSGAPPPPRPVLSAWNANKTLVLLFVHDGGIDDQLVKGAVARLHSLPQVATFVVPAHRIARYAAIAEGVGVNRVPALVVVRPKRLDSAIPSASVLYGYQSPESVVQAVTDAEYKGRTLDYHP